MSFSALCLRLGSENIIHEKNTDNNDYCQYDFISRSRIYLTFSLHFLCRLDWVSFLIEELRTSFLNVDWARPLLAIYHWFCFEYILFQLMRLFCLHSNQNRITQIFLFLLSFFWTLDTSEFFSRYLLPWCFFGYFCGVLFFYLLFSVVSYVFNFLGFDRFVFLFFLYLL